MQKFGVFLLILFSVFVLILAGVLYNKANVTAAFSLPSFIEDERLDKPYIINVFASWCETCNEEHKLWLEIAQKNIIDIYGINYLDTPEKAQKWLQENGNPYKIIATDYDGQISRMLKISGIPETFVIHKGNIIFHVTGNVTVKIWEEQILPLLT